MSNKLPWMKHYADARKDLFLRTLEDRFGHFGYAGWFKMLEVLHEHGSGDNLWITLTQLASELASKPSTVRHLLAICQSSGKILVEANGQKMKITVKNFKEKQRNKSREGTKCAIENSDTAREEGDVEGEGDNNRLGFRAILNSLTAKVSGWRFSASELESHQFPFGKEKGRLVIDMEPSRCEWYLRTVQMDSKTMVALKHRIKLKAQETSR